MPLGKLQANPIDFWECRDDDGKPLIMMITCVNAIISLPDLMITFHFEIFPIIPQVNCKIAINAHLLVEFNFITQYICRYKALEM